MALGIAVNSVDARSLLTESEPLQYITVCFLRWDCGAAMTKDEASQATAYFVGGRNYVVSITRKTKTKKMHIIYSLKCLEKEFIHVQKKGSDMVWSVIVQFEQEYVYWRLLYKLHHLSSREKMTVTITILGM